MRRSLWLLRPHQHHADDPEGRGRRQRGSVLKRGLRAVDALHDGGIHFRAKAGASPSTTNPMHLSWHTERQKARQSQFVHCASGPTSLDPSRQGRARLGSVSDAQNRESQMSSGVFRQEQQLAVLRHRHPLGASHYLACQGSELGWRRCRNFNEVNPCWPGAVLTATALNTGRTMILNMRWLCTKCRLPTGVPSANPGHTPSGSSFGTPDMDVRPSSGCVSRSTDAVGRPSSSRRTP